MNAKKAMKLHLIFFMGFIILSVYDLKNVDNFLSGGIGDECLGVDASQSMHVSCNDVFIYLFLAGGAAFLIILFFCLAFEYYYSKKSSENIKQNDSTLSKDGDYKRYKRVRIVKTLAIAFTLFAYAHIPSPIPGHPAEYSLYLFVFFNIFIITWNIPTIYKRLKLLSKKNVDAAHGSK